jgi:hypothetical protein
MAFLAVSFFAFWNIGRRAMHMQTAAAASNGQQATNASVGSQLKAVLQLTSVSDGSAQGVILEKESENAYHRTNQPMQVSFSKEVNVIMGSINDVHKGAVVHVTGTVGQNKVLVASRIVILTGYVSVR